MRRRWILAATTIVAALAASAAPAGAVTLPANFTDEVVTTVASPTALAWTPDGRMLIATQPGRLRVLSGGTLLATPALDLSTVACSESERGLLGVAVDPQFAANRHIYVYYTFRRASPCSSTNAVNRVSRFVLADTNTVDPASETVLIDNIPSPAGNHNGGDLQFGKDANLYVSIGDGGCDYVSGGGCAGSNDAARDQNVLLGKVLRITPAGAIPADNPFQGLGTGRCHLAGKTTAARCQETFAWGLRNPFRMAFDPNAASVRFYINDVGQSDWEEIDEGLARADYGWNVREGHCATGSTTNCGPPPAGMTNPVFDYGRADGCRSITGGVFVPNGIWGSAFDGKYLFADFACGKIFRLDPNGSGGFTRTDFVIDLGANSVVHLRFGPWNNTQALYYTTYAGGGQVRRISKPNHTFIAGSTWYADGTTSRTGGVGAAVSAFATGAFQNTPYQMVLATAECTTPVAVLNPTTRFANASGFISMTRGTIPAGTPRGTYAVCFRSTSGAPTGTAPATFTVT